jgi:hypothetical protein
MLSLDPVSSCYPVENSLLGFLSVFAAWREIFSFLFSLCVFV